jgi:hypothetical protein
MTHDKWREFSFGVEQLVSMLGREAVEILRIRVTNADSVLHKVGGAEWCRLFDSFTRGIRDILPPHYPVIVLPHGDLVAATDEALTGFFVAKISSFSVQRGLTISTKVTALTADTELDSALGEAPGNPTFAVYAGGRA